MTRSCKGPVAFIKARIIASFDFNIGFILYIISFVEYGICYKRIKHETANANWWAAACHTIMKMRLFELVSRLSFEKLLDTSC